MFLILMIIGLTGLLMMAIPALGGHGHAPPTHGLGPAHGGPLLGHGSGGHVAGSHAGPTHAPGGNGAPTSASHPAGGVSKELASAAGVGGVTRFIPSPRAIFSVLALYGAFGNALVGAAHLSVLLAAVLAVVPAFAVERLVITPVWNLVFRFQAEPSSPLEVLILAEARAVTPFRNGRGLVTIVRDGRSVQFSARLREDQAGLPVKVGEILRVEDVDAQNERVTVSVPRA